MTEKEKTLEAAKKPAAAALDLNKSLAQVGNYVTNHSGFIFAVLVFGLIGYSLFSVSQILQSQNLTVTDSTAKDEYSLYFDKSTIENIQSLSLRQQQYDGTLPTGGRINPFSE